MFDLYVVVEVSQNHLLYVREPDVGVVLSDIIHGREGVRPGKVNLHRSR